MELHMIYPPIVVLGYPPREDRWKVTGNKSIIINKQFVPLGGLWSNQQSETCNN